MAVSYWYYDIMTRTLTLHFQGYKDPSYWSQPCLNPLATINLFSISYTFVISRMLYKWNHTVCNFFWLAFFRSEWLSGDSSRSDMVWWHVSAVCSLLLLSSIPWYGCTRYVQPFTYWRTHWLCPHFGYSNKHIKTFLSKFLCEHLSSFPLGKMPRRVIARSHGS